MKENWTTVIEPNAGLFEIPVKEIIKYRGLIATLVKRNYQVQYKQTVLGPFWLIFQLLFASGIFSFVFGYVGNFASDGTPYFLFYMTGSLVWDFFSGCFSSNTSVLMENTYLLGKVYFPRLIMPISNYLFNLVKVGIKFVVTVIVYLVFLYGGEVGFSGPYILLMLPIVFLSGILGMSLGMIVACATIKYRDFYHVTGVAITLLMYCSPVLYSVNQLPSWLQRVVFINPVSAYIEAFRFAMTGKGLIHWGALGYSFLVTIAIALVAVVIFNQTEKSFIDII